MMRHILLFAALGCLCTLLAAEDNPVTAPQPAAQRPQLVGTGNPEKRPRLAICAFQLRNGRSATLAGREVSGRYLTDKLGEALNDALSQIRKFNLLDRAYNAEVQTELRRMDFASANPEDAVRLGKLMATDYLVVGTAEVLEMPAAQLNPFTGQYTAPPQASFMEVHYRLINAPTGQIVYSNTIALENGEVAGRTADEYISAVVVKAAVRIADEIMDSVMPMEIVGVSGEYVIVGQGGKSVAPGECFDVFDYGEELFDSRTNESLGRVENYVGRIQVVQVNARVAYCAVIKCSRPVAKGMIARRIPGYAAGTGFEEEAPSTRLKTTPSGGYVPPFSN